MQFSNAIQDLVIFNLNYEKRPDKYKISQDTTSLLLFLLSQRNVAPNASFEYTDNAVSFYRETFNALTEISNNKTLADVDPSQNKIRLS